MLDASIILDTTWSFLVQTHKSMIMNLHLIVAILCTISNASPIYQTTMSHQQQQHVFVSKVDPRKEAPYSCECNTLFESRSIDIECKCTGKNLLEIPTHLNQSLNKLTIIYAPINHTKKNSLTNYRKNLQDVILGNLPNLRVIEDGTFANIPNLRTIYISHAPQLKFLSGLLTGVTSTKFYSLRIVQTSLHEIPNLSYLPKNNSMHLLDLDLNKIEKLNANSIKIVADQVTLNYNEINIVEDFAFNGSQISQLSLSGNKRLTQIEMKAFAGLKSLRELDLSRTMIQSLPVIGLNELEELRIVGTPSLKKIPSIYDLVYLKRAQLTYSFHCCAFKYPEQHNPQRYAQYQEQVRKNCQNKDFISDTGQIKTHKVRRKREKQNQALNWGYEDLKQEPIDEFTPNILHLRGHPNKSDHSHLDPLIGRVIEHEVPKPIQNDDEEEFFHSVSFDMNEENTIVMALCGTLSKRSEVKCYPEPNALNPCEDIMGFKWLRISVWFVVVVAILGNLAVIIVVLLSRGDLTVSKFLIANLAFADFSTGLYLLLIASMDLHSVGVYFNIAYEWQRGFGCKMAGFLSVFGSHLSVFTLTVITLERWYAITYAIYLTKRITLKIAIQIMIGGWCYSLFLAALPLFGISDYGSTSICLPMEINTESDLAYLYIIILTNLVAFFIIVFCYTQIYLSLGEETRRCRNKGETTIAKKMALLIFTDFATWAPISFFSLTALAGFPLIGVTNAKILLVFFYPINSCANPCLYAIMTTQYRKDLFNLLSKCGICENFSKRYSEVTTPTAHLRAMPMITRVNGHGQYYVPDAVVTNEDTLI